MPLKVVITYKGAPHQKLRRLKNDIKATFPPVLEAWRERYLAGHFEETAYKKYGYQARSKKYFQTKRRRFGHNRPLVFTGQMKREILRSFRIGRTTSKEGRLVMSAPVYLNYNTKGIDKRAEITRVTDKEANWLAHYFNSLLVDRQVNPNLDPVEVERVT